MQFANNVRQFARKLLLVVAASSLLSGLGTFGPTYSDAYGADSVSFSYAQADSILTLIDQQARDINLMTVDLWEQRQLRMVDSLQARIMQEEYERLLRERRSWYQKVIQHPMVWFVVGTYFGLQAKEGI